MDGHATLEELQNAPPGTVFKERRGAPLEGITLGGVPTQAEYRTAGHASTQVDRRAMTVEGWLRQLEADATELLEG
jgi:hypothetical protein